MYCNTLQDSTCAKAATDSAKEMPIGDHTDLTRIASPSREPSQRDNACWRATAKAGSGHKQTTSSLVTSMVAFRYKGPRLLAASAGRILIMGSTTQAQDNDEPPQ